jgi:TP901 family phage tail tape measure protein
MSDVNANIGVHIDTSQALAELKSLQRQLALFHTSVSKGSASAAAQQRNMQQNLLNTINATGKFSAQMGVVRTSTESFTNSLEKNKFSMREYFRYAGGATKTFGRLFKSEFDTIGKVAEDRVKRLQTQYIKLGRDTSGAMQAISVTPTSLNMKDFGTQVALAAQKQALFNQLMKQGSTNLLNFGKNTQWAGRQLMVGFSVPLAYLGTIAAKTFMDLEAQAIRFKRVYGDMFTTTEQTNKALADIRQLAEEFTKYGVAVVDTMKMAADAAAMGKTGADLTAQVAQATRLAVLGGVEQGQALETTISITNAFGTAAEDLAKKINFLNAVENQTVVSIEDLTIAIPKAGPVVKQLGGDVEDLAFFLTAMKEGGINASEGANALKSGLAALINPTKKASAMLAGFGINIKQIVEGNQGNVRQTVIDFSKALDTLDPLNRARAIEQLFGKFQFSRLSTLFQNVTKDGTQASKVLGLTTNSVEQLAIMSERELGVVENAVGTKFKAAIQDLKLTLEPIGKTFLEAVTPIAQTIADLLDKFNNLGAGTKKFIVVATTLVGIIGPALLMTFGLLANGAANIIKLFLAMRGGFLRLGGNTKILSEQTNYLNTEQLEAATVAASLNQAHSRLTQQFTMETAAVKLLRQAYIDATVAAANFARTNPGMMMPGGKGGKAPKKLAKGTQYVPGTGNKDTVPAVLTPGEAVIPKDVAQDPRFQPIIDAMVNGNLQGFDVGTENAQPSSNIKLRRRKKAIGDATLTKDGKISFGNKRFTTSSQLTSTKLMDQINLQLAEAEAEGGVGRKTATKTILNRMENLQAREGKVSASRVFKHIVSGRSVSGGAGSNNPQILKLRKEINAQTAGSGLDRETIKLKAALASAGLSQKEQADFLRKQESHILKPEGLSGSADPRKWQAGQVTSEYGGLNNYLNRAGGSSIGNMIDGITKDPSKLQTLGYTPKQIRQLSYDYAFAKTGKHPTTSKEFQSISRIAKFEVDMHEKGLAKIDKINQAKGISALASVREPSFYKKYYKKVIQLGAGTASRVSRGKVEGFSREQQRQIASGVVTGQTGVLKSATTRTTSGAPSEKRQVSLGKNETILNKKTTAALKSGKTAFVPGLGQFRMINSLVAGAEDGIPKGQQTRFTPNGGGSATESAKLGDVEKQFRAEQNSLRRQIQKAEQRRIVALKEEEKQSKSQSQQREKNINATKQNTTETLTAKQKLSEFSGKASVGIGAVSGLTIAASFAGGKLGEMAQKIMPFVFGLQGLVMLLPLLANPFVAAVAGFAVLGGLVIKMGKDIEKAREEGINLANAMSMTSKKLVDLSIVAGNVSATEAANRKRQNLVSGTVDAQRQFGQNALESEFGKGLLADIATQGKSGGTNKEIAQNMANQLSTAVLQGAVTTEQAKSIASALGEKLGSYEIPLLISGKIVSLLGPNGERLDKEPLQIALAIKKESAKNLQTAFDQAQNNRKQQITAGGLGALTAGVGAIGLGGAMAATGVGIIPGAIVAGAGAAAITKAIYDQNKAKAANAKLDSASIQLGLEAIVQNQQLVDGLNKEYDLKIQNAKTEKEILDLQAQRKIDLGLLNAANKQTVDDVVGLSSQISAENFNKAIGTSIDNLYKDASDAVKVFKDIAKDELNDLANTDFKKTIQIGFASGQLTPNAVINLLDASKKVPAIETKIKAVVEKQGFAEASTLLELMGQTGANAKTIDLMLNYINTNEVDFDKDMTALDILAKFQQKYGVQLDLSVNGAGQLAVANAALSKISTYPDKIDIKVVQELAGANPELFGDALKNFDKLSEGNPLISKTLLVNYRVGKMDPQLKAAAIAEYKGMSEQDAIATYLAKGFNAATPPPQGGGTPPEGSGKRDTVLDDLLLKLKLFRKESVNALGGWQELIKQLGSGKSINAFKGTTNQLQGIGGNESLVQFAEGLGAEEAGKFFDKITTKAKNGKLVLNDYGKSLNKLFPTVQAGLYLRQQDQITREQTTQNKALAMLKARGVDAATALELTADAATAAAIISKDLDGKDLEKMIANTKKATAATREFEKALRATQFAADEMAEGAAEKLTEAFDYSYLEIERKARETFKSVNGMTPEAVELSITVDERAISKIQDQISGINSNIKTYSRTLDLIGRQETSINDTYDKKIEAINKQKDALESVKTINSFLMSQQQKQLGLANALTQGDISAAAEAMQAMRAEAAQEALNRMSSGLDTATTNLEAQKQREISSITAVVNGQKMTRQQIDQQILSLNDQIYTIETTQLEPLQAQADKKRQILSDLDFQIQKEQTSLQINGMTRAEWDLIQQYTDAANKHLDEIKIDIDQVAKSSKSAADNWAAILKSMQMAKALGNITTKTTTTTTSVGAFDKNNMYGGKIKPMNMGGVVPKYFASGGRMGSDSVPSMLTPGEFVINKKASQEFGPLLSMLNESKYPSMIGSSASGQVPINNALTSVSDNSTAVYNYSLGFNVNGSNANPNEIANAVMTKIKQVDAQRIRRQRA